MLRKATITSADGQQKPMWYGDQILNTGGGVQAITLAGALPGDIAIVTLYSDDSGTAITLMTWAVTANTLTITRNDDSSSADDGIVTFQVMRP